MNKKKYLIFGIVGLFAMVLVTGAVLEYFGFTEREVIVTAATIFSGNGIEDVEAIGGEISTSEEMAIGSLTTVNAPLSIETTVSPEAEGTKHTVNYLLDADGIIWDSSTGYSELDEEFGLGRSEITYLTSMTLGELASIDFDEYVSEGYPVSVNILLDVNGDGEFNSKKDLTTGYLTDGEDDVLKIEWAYNGATAGYPDAYMESEDHETWSFEGMGTIDDTTQAWIYSVKPGDVEMIKDTLANWKAGKSRGATCYYVDDAWKSEACDDITINSDTMVYGIQIESLGWIAKSNSKVKNVKINDVSVSDEPTLIPGSDLNFNVETKFPLDIVEGTYTVETAVNLRA